MGPWPEFPPVLDTVSAFMLREFLEYSVMRFENHRNLVLNYMIAHLHYRLASIFLGFQPQAST